MSRVAPSRLKGFNFPVFSQSTHALVQESKSILPSESFVLTLTLFIKMAWKRGFGVCKIMVHGQFCAASKLRKCSLSP